MFSMKKKLNVIIVILVFILILIGIIYFYLFNTKIMENISITSKDFSNWDFITKDFTCDWSDKIPSFEIWNLPDDTKSLALIVDDPDAPSWTRIHFVAFDIDNYTKKSLTLFSDNKSYYKWFKVWKNSANEINWQWPCPPKWNWVHRYFFKFYALDIEKVDLQEWCSKQELLDATKNHIIWYWEIVAKYERN